MKFILASSSPRRQMLLKRLNISFDIMPPDIDETIIIPDGNPEKYCIDLAKLKANDISPHYPNKVIIGADTIVVIGDEILCKPENKTSAKYMLNKLNNSIHQVYTGVSIIWDENKIYHSFAEITSVTFRNLKDEEIDYYIQSFPPLDKAGAYGIQDWSAIFVKEIKGCYDNVVGFPISRFYQELKKIGINLLDSN